MKNVLLSSLLLVSVLAVSACSSMGTTSDESLTQAPYSEERTVGTSGSQAPVVRSAAPVFESRQVK